MRSLIVLLFLIFSFKLDAQEISPLRSTDDLDDIKKSTSGKVTLVNIWASWCKPCVEEFPDLVKLYRDYKDKGFTLVFISVDSKDEIKEKVIPFLEKHKVDFTTYYVDFKSMDDFINYFDKNWEGAIPSTYIYGKNGKLAQKFIGNRDYEYFEKEIQKLLN